MADTETPLSNLPELVLAAQFMEDVQAYMQGAEQRFRPAGTPAARCRTPLLPALLPRPHAQSLVCADAGRKAEDVISELRDSHQKYKYIEAELVQRKRRLAFKRPEIQKCLDAVNLLLQRHEAGESVRGDGQLEVLRSGVDPNSAMAMPACPVSCLVPPASRLSHTPPPPIFVSSSSQTVLDFSLSDQVYARARVAEVESVNLWLGAGVMLEYPLPEARALLERQLAGCKQQLEVVQWEHEYIKDQLTTTEVGAGAGERRAVKQRAGAVFGPPCCHHVLRSCASQSWPAGFHGAGVQLGRAKSAARGSRRGSVKRAATPNGAGPILLDAWPMSHA